MRETASNMASESHPVAGAEGEQGALLILAMLSLLAGAGAGVPGGGVFASFGL
jgi:hypothetical protein